MTTETTTPNQTPDAQADGAENLNQAYIDYDIETPQWVAAAPENREIAIRLIREAINGIGERGGEIEELWAGSDGIQVTYGYDDTCRGCFMGRIRNSYTIPWDAVLGGDGAIEAWIKGDRERQAAAEREKEERERREKEKADARRQEERDRAEYARLTAKYGQGS